MRAGDRPRHGHDTSRARRRHPDRPEPSGRRIGDSGHGKTTVARALTDRLRGGGVRILWAAARDHDELAEGLRRAATALGASVRSLGTALRADPIERVDRLWKLLDDAPGPWVLVLDDAGDDAVGAHGWCRRSPAGTVVVTSRFGPAERWGADVVVDPVEPLGADDGARVVLDRLFGVGTHVDDIHLGHARVLSEQLGGVPIALISAAGAASRGGKGRLERLVAAIEPLTTHDDTRPPVAAAFGTCVDAIAPAKRDHALAMLRRAASFAVDEPLPVPLLDGFPPDVLAELIAVGLVREVRAVAGRRCVRLHPAVAELARQDEHDLTAALAALGATADSLDAGLPSDWPLLRALQPHVEAMLDAVEPRNAAVPPSTTWLAEALHAADVVATGLMRADSYPSATALLDRALDVTASLGGDHPTQLEAQQTRAWMAATADGDLVTAEEQLRQIVAAKIRVLGRHHADTMSARDCLAWLLAEQRDLVPAVRRFTGVLVDRTERLGPRHRDTLATRHRLAWALALAGRVDDATDELRRVVSLRAEVLGTTEHLEVHISRYRLAWLLARTDRCDEALAIFDDLGAMLGRTIGTTHPMSLMVRSRMAWVATRQVRFEAARTIYDEVLLDQEKVLGADHPRTLRTRYLLGKLHLKEGRTGTAVTALRDVALARRVVLGPDHPYTLDSRSFQAWAAFKDGRIATAAREFEAVLADRRRVLGESDPATLMTQYLLARVVTRQGRLDEARDNLRDLVAIGRVVHGRRSRPMLEVRHSLAYVEGLRGRLAECERSLRIVLADREDVLGPHHRDTMATLDYLSWAVGVAGRHAEARVLCGRALTRRRDVLGADHPHTLTSLYRHAWLLGVSGDHELALTRMSELDGRLDALGRPQSHPDRMRCRLATVWLLRLTGRLGEAEILAKEVVDEQTRIHGPFDVEVMRCLDALGLVLLRRGHRHGAQAVFTDVLTRRKRALGPTHPDTVTARRHLEMVGKDRHRRPPARELDRTHDEEASGTE